MTKQEEIREGMYSLGFMPEHFQHYEIGGTISLSYKAVAKILTYLHSQGVVVKVERELPDTPYWKQHRRAVEVEVTAELLKAGYVAVEPLIEAKDAI